MGRYEITCINKRGDHFDPHERIEFIGQQATWKISEDKAIRRIEAGQDSFYVNVDGKSVNVIVATHKWSKVSKDRIRRLRAQ